MRKFIVTAFTFLIVLSVSTLGGSLLSDAKTDSSGGCKSSGDCTLHGGKLQAAPAGSACLRKLSDVENLIDQAESQQSTGKIHGCFQQNIEARLPERERGQFQLTPKQKILSPVPKDIKSLFTAYNGLQSHELAGVGAELSSNPGNICGSSDAVKTQVSSLDNKLIMLTHGKPDPKEPRSFGRQLALLNSYQKAFKASYERKNPDIKDPTALRTSCRDTGKNVGFISGKLNDAVKQCSADIKQTADTSKAVSDLNASLQQGCNRAATTKSANLLEGYFCCNGDPSRKWTSCVAARMFDHGCKVCVACIAP
jgi:hypothetical protein